MIDTGVIHCGDCLELMRGWPDGCVDCCVTSPPYYGLRDYGTDGQLGLEPTMQGYIDKLVAVFREVRRVLKPEGTCWLNIGDSYAGSGKGRNGDGSHQEGGKQGTNRGTVDGCLHGTPADECKAKDLMMIPARVALALQADGWYLRSDIIWAKCISGGAVVYAQTQKGEMPMTVKDMVRLDPATVKLWDGATWNQAVSWEHVEPVGTELEFELRNGVRIAATANHRWPTQRGIIESRNMVIGDTLESAALPEPQTPRKPTMLPDDIGWFVGLYIAEGSQSDGTIQISGHTKEHDRYDRLCRITAEYDGHIARHQTSPHGETININSPMLLGIINTYVSGGTAHDKHLHTRCWKRSNAFLLEVLNGYLSGDGGYVGGRWRLGFTNNDALASDLRTMSARVGASLRLRRRIHKLGDQEFPGWSGSLYLDPARRRHSDYDIVEIRKPRARKYWDIVLQDDPHTFALACGALTHNSNPMPESVTDRPTSSYEHIFLLTKQARYWYDADAIAEPLSESTLEWAGGKAGWGASNLQHGTPHRTHGPSLRGEGRCGENGNTRNARNVWTIATKPYKDAHFATFPPELPRRCILAGCPTGGTVLEPFCGSGTVGMVAEQLGRQWVGIELSPEYAEMARKRTAQRGLFASNT